jgi:hypothetical protein
MRLRTVRLWRLDSGKEFVFPVFGNVTLPPRLHANPTRPISFGHGGRAGGVCPLKTDIFVPQQAYLGRFSSTAPTSHGWTDLFGGVVVVHDGQIMRCEPCLPQRTMSGGQTSLVPLLFKILVAVLTHLTTIYPAQVNYFHRPVAYLSLNVPEASVGTHSHLFFCFFFLNLLPPSAPSSCPGIPAAPPCP